MPSDEYPEGMNPFCLKCRNFHSEDAACGPKQLTREEKELADLKLRIFNLETLGRAVPLLHDGDPHGTCVQGCRACAFQRLLNGDV